MHWSHQGVIKVLCSEVGVAQGWPTSVMESHSPPEFCFNLDRNLPACSCLVTLRPGLACSGVFGAELGNYLALQDQHWPPLH